MLNAKFWVLDMFQVILGEVFMELYRFWIVDAFGEWEWVISSTFRKIIGFLFRMATRCGLRSHPILNFFNCLNLFIIILEFGMHRWSMQISCLLKPCKYFNSLCQHQHIWILKFRALTKKYIFSVRSAYHSIRKWEESGLS